MTGEGRQQRRTRRKLRERKRERAGGEEDQEAKAKENENSLPEWFSNRAHAQHNVEIVSYPLNEVRKHCIRHVSYTILLSWVAQGLPHLA